LLHGVWNDARQSAFSHGNAQAMTAFGTGDSGLTALQAVNNLV
jgi:hypothetical protein